MLGVSTILIIDDDPRFRTQAGALLEADGFEVVGQAVDGGSGLHAVESLRPDFVLIDIGLPDIDGFEVARSLAIEGPPPLVVLTSTRDARAYGRRLAEIECLGFIPKERVSGAAIRGLAEQQ
jgi:two-component system, NarL family, nitrate/nitrite response regulator NarL